MEDFPNYHPMIVHFPIVLLLLAAVMQLVGFGVKNKGFHYTILVFAVLGYASAYFAAAWRHPQIEREAVSAAVLAIFDEHQLYARWSVYLGGAGAVLKGVELYFRQRLFLVLLTALALSGAAVAGGGRHTRGQVSQRLQRLFARICVDVYYRAKTGIRGRVAPVFLETQIAHPGYLRTRGEQASLRSISGNLPQRQVGKNTARRNHPARCPENQRAGASRRFHFVFPAPDADAAVQYGHFKWFQHAFSRKTQTRFVVGVSENAGSGARN
jgi:hypothetical protein